MLTDNNIGILLSYTQPWNIAGVYPAFLHCWVIPILLPCWAIPISNILFSYTLSYYITEQSQC